MKGFPESFNTAARHVRSLALSIRSAISAIFDWNVNRICYLTQCSSHDNECQSWKEIWNNRSNLSKVHLQYEMFTSLAKCLHWTWHFLPQFHVPKLLHFMLHKFCTVQINYLIAIWMPGICCGLSAIQFTYQMWDKVFLLNWKGCTFNEPTLAGFFFMFFDHAS